MDIVNLMQSMSVNEPEENSEFNIFAVNIDDVHTDIVISEFASKSMFIATQYGKIGALLKVAIDQPEDDLGISEPVYTVSLLFGADNIEQQAAARFLAEKLNIKKVFLVFLCLKDYSPSTLKQLLEAVKQKQV